MHRAVYADGDIVLLDDPLSSVDVYLGRHIFEKVIRGLLKRKSVLLTTHQVQFLLPVQKILVLNSRGNLEASGTYSELQQSNQLQFGHGKYFQSDNVLPIEHDIQKPLKFGVDGDQSDFVDSEVSGVEASSPLM
jgi:ABC-type multidrug transport system ATPase subunit